MTASGCGYRITGGVASWSRLLGLPRCGGSTHPSGSGSIRRVTSEPDVAVQVEQRFAHEGLRVFTRVAPNGVEVDLIGVANPDFVMRSYACAPTSALAVLAAEQRWLVEQEGCGSFKGDTYVDKARERLCRALT